MKFSLSSLLNRYKRQRQYKLPRSLKKKDYAPGSGTAEHRAAIVDALNTAIEIFTSHDEKTFDEVMAKGIRPIADAVGLDRVVFYHRLDIDGEMRFGQIFRWDKAEGGLISLDDELKVLPDTPLMAHWIAMLAEDGFVRIRRSDMLKDEQAFADMFGFKSIIILPVFTHGQFWGGVCFQDHVNDKYFDEGCADLLHSAARLFANAIIRADLAQSAEKAVATLERREKMASMLNMASLLFLSQTEDTFENTMTTGVKLIVDTVDVDRLSVWRNTMMSDGLHTAQIYRWDRELGGTTDPTTVLKDVTYTQLAPRWEEVLGKNEIINSPAHLLPEAAMLKSFGVVSALVLPVFFNNAFWGFVLFEDRQNERYFDEDSVETMRSAAFLCVNTVIRFEMEQSIANANELNRALVETAPIGITIFDENLHFTDFNVTILNAYGGTKEQFINNFADFSPEYQKDGSKSADKITDIMKRTLNGESMIYEWTHRSISGELIPFEVTTTRVKHNDKYIGVAFQYDLRNIKKMEKDIAEAEEMTRAIIEASPVSYMLFDEDFRPTDCNDVLLKMVGCTDKQYFLEHYWDIFVPESQLDGNNSFKSAHALAKKMSFNEQITVEWMQRTVSGELIPMENTLTHIIYKDQKYLITFKYDMRHIKKMSESLEEQSALLKTRLEQQELISEISRGFIASGDSETYVKEAIAKMGRYHDVSLVIIFAIDYQKNKTNMAYHWSAYNAPPRLAKFNLLGLIRANFPERLPECAAVPVISYDDIASGSGEDFRPLLAIDIAAFICAPLYVEGKLWGVLSVEQFSRPRRWTENEKNFVAMTASTIAGVIMRDIYNIRLKNALDKATAASKAKGEFLSNMSHEMRTPLNAIIGMTAIGRNAADMERKDYALDKIDNASAHLLGVINDVLDMSKIEANMLELSPVEFNFEKMLQRVVNVINFRVEEKQQKLMIHIDEQIPETLVGDDQRLAQVITNLLGNSVKFTPEQGSITLDVKMVKEENSICTVQIAVSDTGIGISPEQQARVFSSFEQAESSTTRKFGGSGLGLAISKTIVEMMGGKIWIESEIDKGSTFTFTIRMRRGAAKRQGLLASTINWGNVHIMVVDDDPDILEYVREIVQRIGAVCDTAVGGNEALKLVEQNGSYNIYFVDWKMPGIDGITLTSMLKEKQPDPGNTVVIMISAAEWNTVETEARKAGVDKFLSKPLFQSTIVDVIGECLGLNQEQVEQVPVDLAGCFSGRRILLAEDVEINREIVLSLFETTLLEIDCAVNGAEAVRMFSAAPGKYELIFMDVQMPEMDGYEATRRIRAMDIREAKNIPIIAMTANVFREDVEKCLAAGMNDHVGKPLDFDEVVGKMRGFLK